MLLKITCNLNLINYLLQRRVSNEEEGTEINKEMLLKRQLKCRVNGCLYN
jgi:hypothetical protein